VLGVFVCAIIRGSSTRKLTQLIIYYPVFILFFHSLRADFLEIVRDLHVRSSALEKTKAKVKPTDNQTPRLPFRLIPTESSLYSFLFYNSILIFHALCVWYRQALDKEVRLSGDLSELFIGEDSYSTGDLCTVFSVLSQVPFVWSIRISLFLFCVCVRYSITILILFPSKC